MVNQLIELALCLAALAVGYRLPDIDLAPVLPVRHRSAFTHGPLWAVLGVWAAATFPQFGVVIVFALLAVTLHLLEDVSPRKWQGSALVNLFPLPLSLPAVLSWLYLAISTIVTASVVVGMIVRQ